MEKQYIQIFAEIEDCEFYEIELHGDFEFFGGWLNSIKGTELYSLITDLRKFCPKYSYPECGYILPHLEVEIVKMKRESINPLFLKELDRLLEICTHCPNSFMRSERYAFKGCQG